MCRVHHGAIRLEPFQTELNIMIYPTFRGQPRPLDSCAVLSGGLFVACLICATPSNGTNPSAGLSVLLVRAIIAVELMSAQSEPQPTGTGHGFLFSMHEGDGPEKARWSAGLPANTAIAATNGGETIVARWNVKPH